MVAMSATTYQHFADKRSPYFAHIHQRHVNIMEALHWFSASRRMHLGYRNHSLKGAKVILKNESNSSLWYGLISTTIMS